MGLEIASGYDAHADIAAALDEARDQGLISEYLVSWRGREGRLVPKVTVWSDAEQAPDEVRGEILQSLTGLVTPRRIIVLDDGQP